VNTTFRQAASIKVNSRNLSVLITNDWELYRGRADFVNVLDPLVVRVNVIGTQSNNLDIALLEFWCQLCDSAQFGSADGCEVIWVRKEDSPAVTDPVVELDSSSAQKRRKTIDVQ